MALLLNAEQHSGKARSVNEFIREFHGLSGTGKAKAVAQAANLTGAMLHDLIDDGDVDGPRLARLLVAMQEAARPVKPERLGILDKEHCAQQLAWYGVAPDSIEYRRAQGETEGLPWVIEVAFGVKLDGEAARTLQVGINFSPALEQPFVALDDALDDARCTRIDPVVMLVHLTCPLVAFSDRGKTHASLPAPVESELARLVRLVTVRFTTAKKQAGRADRMSIHDLDTLRTAHKPQTLTVKAAAWRVMERAYWKASNNGTLPANARQIMYAARPLIIDLTGKASPWKNSATFTQQLLPDYIDAHPEQCAGWDVVFDDRGHFAEPHTQYRIGVGTLAVRDYTRRWHRTIATDLAHTVSGRINTTGPALCYRFALFIEKEGFNPLLERARIAERYDLALLSTKGMSVTAARQLVERLSEEGVTTLVLHDFDKAGFSISHTLQNDTRRYRFKTRPRVIDLGLRLADVERMGLDSEAVEYSGDVDPRPGLIERGATPEEAAYLVTGKQDGKWTGRRVELNAMDAQQFLDWLEGKLQAHGVRKFVPDDPETLKAAWQRAWRIGELNRAIQAAAVALPDPPEPPTDLLEQVNAALEANPALRWDAALAALRPLPECWS